jgi:oligopeptide transport system substrate-binding protein
MGIWVAFPAKEENITEGGEIWWTSPVYQVGNGPFIWDVGEPFVRGTFSPNSNYWDAKPTYSIEYRYITDTAVAFEAYKNKELDIVAAVGEDLGTIEADPALKAQHMKYAGSCTFAINFGMAAKYTAPDGSTYDSPFLDKKVREAFALAFDAESWSKDVDSGLSTPTWTWIPPGFPGYDAASPLKFDPEAAKAALAASTFGGPDKLNALGLKLTFGDTPRNRGRSEWLVAKYKEFLGVDIALDPVDPTTFTAISKDPTTYPLLARAGWCADYPDPQNWLSVYWKSTTSFAQRPGYVNLEFDALVDQADIELDPAKRMDLYAQAQQMLLADIPAAFGYNNANSYMVQPWVSGIVTTPQDSDWPGSFSVATIKIDTMMP